MQNSRDNSSRGGWRRRASALHRRVSSDGLRHLREIALGGVHLCAFAAISFLNLLFSCYASFSGPWVQANWLTGHCSGCHGTDRDLDRTSRQFVPDSHIYHTKLHSMSTQVPRATALFKHWSTIIKYAHHFQQGHPPHETDHATSTFNFDRSS